MKNQVVVIQPFKHFDKFVRTASRNNMFGMKKAYIPSINCYNLSINYPILSTILSNHAISNQNTDSQVKH